MIANSTVQFVLVGMTAFCISFGFIYSLIFCYKSKRQHQSGETEALRDEFLKDKLISRRKSTSLTSPPMSDTVINPNYTSSPYKVPTRHLRSTSATYSPTHYLSPHHRRNSTPTQSHSLPAKSISVACSKCKRNLQQSPSSEVGGKCGRDSDHSCHSKGLVTMTTPSPTLLSIPGECECEYECTHDPEFLSMHKFIPIPSPSSSSKYGSDSEDSKSLEEGKSGIKCSWDTHKSFSFGPIPARKRVRNEKQVVGAIANFKGKIEETENECELKCALDDKSAKELSSPEKKIVDDEQVSESDSLLQKGKMSKKKTYTPDLFKKENIVLEEIPYYVESVPVNWN